jgi:uncharacterized membrane protein YkoI
MVRSNRLLKLAVFACSGLLVATSIAARDLDQDEALRLRLQGIILPLEDLLQRAMALHPDARLLEAELEEHDQRYVYEVELLTPAQIVREIKIDARTGELLEDKEDD